MAAAEGRAKEFPNPTIPVCPHGQQTSRCSPIELGGNKSELVFALSTFWAALGMFVIIVSITNNFFLLTPYRSACWILWSISGAEGQLSGNFQVTAISSASFMNCSGCCDLLLDLRLQASPNPLNWPPHD